MWFSFFKSVVFVGLVNCEIFFIISIGIFCKV